MRRFVFRPYALIAMAVATVILSAMGGDSFLLTVMALVLTPISLALGFFWPAKWGGGPQWLRSRATVQLSVALIASVLWTQWPLRLEYRLLRPMINSIAAQVDNGQKVKTPIQLGLLRVNQVETRRGVVCLWLEPDPGGSTGFVRTPIGKVYSQFNIWSTLQLDKDWQYITED